MAFTHYFPHDELVSRGEFDRAFPRAMAIAKNPLSGADPELAERVQRAIDTPVPPLFGPAVDASGESESKSPTQPATPRTNPKGLKAHTHWRNFIPRRGR